MQSVAQTLAPVASTQDEFRFWLDEPAAWDRPVRILRVSGWCVSKNAARLVAIRARVGNAIHERRFDRERPDVPDYVGIPGAPRWCGFSIELELPPGAHRLALDVSAGDGKWREVFATTTIGAAELTPEESAALATRPQLDRFDIWFDRPANWAAPGSVFYISGWCVDRSGAAIEGIRARCGDQIFAGHYGIERADVAALFPFTPRALRSGFAIAATPPSGSAKIDIETLDADGKWRVVTTHRVVVDCTVPEPQLAPGEKENFTTKPAHRSRFAFWVDPPPDWSAPIRYLHLSGWCFALAGSEVTELRARVRSKVYPVFYGIPRPDVAVAYERRPGSLRNGFSADVIVPWGRTTVVLEARSFGGDWEPVWSQRVRGPLAWHREDLQSAIGNYPAWIRQYDTLTRADRKWIRDDIRAFRTMPLFSVLMPVFNPEPAGLQQAIDSVRAELYENWQLCIVDDASTDPRVWRTIERAARRDPRIKINRHAKNQHISATSNDALGLATGDYIALLDHDDELAPTALYFAARELNRDPQLRVLYTDEDKLDAQGRRHDPHFKPDWNPDLFTSQNYISHLAIYQAALVRDAGGFRVGFEGSQDYDLTLRCIERIEPAQIHHIPHVLYHWRATAGSAAKFAHAKTYAHDAATRAVREHFDRRGMAVTVAPDREIYLHARYTLPSSPPLVSIIIPTRDREPILRRCIDSILEKTDYAPLEIVIIDNGSTEPATRDYFASLGQESMVRIIASPGEFNYSKLNNLGVREARGEIVALLNNDLEVIDRHWLGEMVSHALRPEIGAVGARLWYPNDTIQHAGVILGAGGIGNHAHAGLRDEPGYFSRAHLVQNFSAVTGACIVLRKDVYEKAGGLDETNLAVAFNDVDFCLRLTTAGYRIVWTPHANLYHHESMSRGFEDTTEKRGRFLAEVDYMRRTWGDRLENDPAYNPNLSLGEKLWTLASPPRVQKPWRKR